MTDAITTGAITTGAITTDAITTDDWHAAGEPFRIVTSVPTEGGTVAERRIHARSGEPDAIRRFLCLEPRGHDDMYGGLITPPDDDGADFGVLFWHKDGFSTACGHGTMALGAWAVATGRVAAPDDGEAVVTIDVPSGRVQARVQREGGRTTASSSGTWRRASLRAASRWRPRAARSRSTSCSGAPSTRPCRRRRRWGSR